MIETLTVCLFVAASSGTPPIFSTKIQKTAKDQPRIIFAQRKAPTATLRIQFAAGSYDDGTRRGLTRLTQLALIEGAGDALKRSIFEKNATLSIQTAPRKSAFVLSAPAKDFSGLAQTVLKAIFETPITNDALQRARTRLLYEPSENETHDDLATMFATTVSSGYLSNAPDGNAEHAAELELETVTWHQKTVFAPANATVILTGAFPTKRFARLLSRYRGGTPTEPLEKRTRLSGIHAAWSGWELHVIAYPAPLSSVEDVAVLHLLAAIIDERLRLKLRADGLVYSVDAMSLQTEWLDAVMVILPLGEALSNPAVKTMHRYIEELVQNGLTSAEVERNRTYLLKTWTELNRQPEPLAALLGRGSSALPHVSPKVVGAIRALDIDQIMDRVSRWMKKSCSIHAQFSREAPRRQEDVP